jgi:hypothetical protein
VEKNISWEATSFSAKQNSSHFTEPKVPAACFEQHWARLIQTTPTHIGSLRPALISFYHLWLFDQLSNCQSLNKNVIRWSYCLHTLGQMRSRWKELTMWQRIRLHMPQCSSHSHVTVSTSTDTVRVTCRVRCWIRWCTYLPPCFNRINNRVVSVRFVWQGLFRLHVIHTCRRSCLTHKA